MLFTHEKKVAKEEPGTITVKKRGADVFLRECPILFSNQGALRWRHFLHAFPVQRKRDLEGRWAKIGDTTNSYGRRESLSPLALGRGSNKRGRI